MDSVILIIVLKGLGMFAALTGGILAIIFGFKVYKSGIGKDYDKAAFELGWISLKANTVGSVIMASSFVWAWAGVALSPNMEKSSESIRVYSMKSAVGDVEALALTYKNTSPTPVNKDKEINIKEAFEKANQKMAERGVPFITSLDGKPATIDISSSKITHGKNEDHLLQMDIKTKQKRAMLIYKILLEKDEVVFLPIEAGSSDHENTTPPGA